MEDLKQYSAKIESILESISQPIKPYLPWIARFLLVVTFLEDSLRITSQWGEQTTYLEKYRGFHWTLSRLFLSLNVLTMLVCSSLAMIKKYTELACGGLLLVIVSQAIGYGLIFDTNFFLRNLSVVGGLLMLLADALSASKRKNIFAGIPISVNELDKSSYFQLAGRILLVFLFMSFLLAGSFSVMRVVASLVGAVGCVMIVVGFKTKWVSWFLVAFLSISNVLLNNWWSLHHGHPQKDFLKYDFFQTLSIMGGFLLLLNLGPGGLSMDEKKKSF
ncbi:hypothetical protein SmJEL517_g02521 [Synchytrium microbalum]|uniref:Surfeit locus protein 4 n=1 Tax=Synchytrium microbalum TaxID=1806994 RepID=A0A507CC06_9FUNG|nr:uncharacterized protein SmJEL517_g02521 [Synchytrium microbalum]TPX35095.1 hypothetical protein SmJEL517_g02521 [Synchytrium microbalum]